MTILSSSVACNYWPGKDDFHMDAYPDFRSSYVQPRQIEVFLPPDYDPDFSYDVIYMHDGQNVFNAHTSFAGIAWEADKAMLSLLRADKIRAAIIVAIWNSPERMQEYMPAKPANRIKEELEKTDEWAGPVISDEYLRFLVYELKPFIDSTYSTNPSPEATFIMGSSMGGLISFYALTEYPGVFGGAACVSTHWPALNGVFLEYVKDHIPDPGNHIFYFDFGTKTLDSIYEPFQQEVDKMMEEKGYAQGKNWITRKFEGADHSEKSWQERVHVPISFLLGKER